MKKISILIMCCVAYTATNAQNWQTTGNSGLTSSNFLGTTDANDLIFKINNAERGRLLAR